MLTIHEVVQSAVEDFKDRLADGEGSTEDEAYDLIHEIADSHVPIHYYKVLEVAMSNLWLATSEPELGPAFGQSSPVHFIMSNIYEHLSCELTEWYNENKIES